MIKRFFLTLTLLIVVAGLFPQAAKADVNDFVIRNFYGQYDLSDEVNGGRMTVEERIDLTYSDFNHGILRAIPRTYQDNDLKLDILSVKRDGRDEPYSTYRESGNLVLKIGDEDNRITGQHTYNIKYSAENIILFKENHEEWYWDINGDQWQQPFLKISGEVTLPDSAMNAENLPEHSCYAGKFRKNTRKCRIDKTETGYVFTTLEPLGPKETLTVAVPLKDGVFKPRTTTDWVRDNLWQFIGMLAGGGLVYVAYKQWKDHGKDYKGKGTIVPHYKPPKDLSPAEAGMLMDYNVDSRDLSATIIDLAIRGYLKIHEDEKKHLFGLIKNHEFTLELVKTSKSDLKDHERKLLEAIFTNYKKSSKIKVKKISKTAMQKAIPKIKAEVKDYLIEEHGLVDEIPGKAIGILVLIGIGSLLVLFIFRPGWGWIVGMVSAAAVAIVFGALMRRRSHAGVEYYEQLKGLKWYMDTAEKDRMKMMQSVERPYAEPSKNVNLFESLLPFAVAMGVEKSWAKQFDDIYNKEPDWYSGSRYFAANSMASGLTSGLSSMSTSFSHSTSSSSSGTGGGGYSGGGGGGGGGGGW